MSLDAATESHEVVFASVAKLKLGSRAPSVIGRAAITAVRMCPAAGSFAVLGPVHKYISLPKECTTPQPVREKEGKFPSLEAPVIANTQVSIAIEMIQAAARRLSTMVIATVCVLGGCNEVASLSETTGHHYQKVGPTLLSDDDVFMAGQPDSINHLHLRARLTLPPSAAGVSFINDIRWDQDGRRLGTLSAIGRSLTVFNPATSRPLVEVTVSGSEVGLESRFEFINGTSVLAFTSDPVTRDGLPSKTRLVSLNVSQGGGAPSEDRYFSRFLGLESPFLLSVSDNHNSAAAVGRDPAKASEANTQQTSATVRTASAAPNKVGRDITFTSEMVRNYGFPTSLSLSGDGRRLAVGTGLGWVLMFSTAPSRLLTSSRVTHAACGAVQLNVHGNVVAVGVRNVDTALVDHNSVIVYDVDSQRRMYALAMPQYEYPGGNGLPQISSLTWDQGHDLLAAGGADGVAVWRRAVTGPEPVFFQRMVTDKHGLAALPPFRVAYSAQGLLAVAAKDSVLIYS